MPNYQELYERCKLEAKIHAGEARCANHTIGAIYQLCTGARGEPGNWNGAEPVRRVVRELEALRAVGWAAQGLINADTYVTQGQTRQEAVAAAETKLRQELGKWQMEFCAAEAQAHS